MDELPQIWNVARGSMTWVGPRPLVAKDHYSLKNLARRESILPGITGPWQLTRSSKHDYSDMERLDATLTEAPGLALRWSILLLTIYRCARLAVGALPGRIQPKVGCGQAEMPNAASGGTSNTQHTQDRPL